MGSQLSQVPNSLQDVQQMLLQTDKEVIAAMKEMNVRVIKSVGLGLGVGAIICLLWFLEPNADSRLKPFVNTECVVCQEDFRSVIILPCLHFSLCRECANNIQQCPMCRVDIGRAMSIIDFLDEAPELFPE